MSDRILIVDDEPFMLKLIEASLKKGGFEVTACRSGEEALKVAVGDPPRLIIMDMMMPGLDGLAILRKLKESDPLRDVPVIMLTAKGHRLAQEAVDSGAHAFLTKPFSPTRLLEEARRLLDEEPKTV